jgi:hypothetical protein
MVVPLVLWTLIEAGWGTLIRPSVIYLAAELLGEKASGTNPYADGDQAAAHGGLAAFCGLYHGDSGGGGFERKHQREKKKCQEIANNKTLQAEQECGKSWLAFL